MFSRRPTLLDALLGARVKLITKRMPNTTDPKWSRRVTQRNIMRGGGWDSGSKIMLSKGQGSPKLSTHRELKAPPKWQCCGDLK